MGEKQNNLNSPRTIREQLVPAEQELGCWTCSIGRVFQLAWEIRISVRQIYNTRNGTMQQCSEVMLEISKRNLNWQTLRARFMAVDADFPRWFSETEGRRDCSRTKSNTSLIKPVGFSHATAVEADSHRVLRIKERSSIKRNWPKIMLFPLIWNVKFAYLFCAALMLRK